MHLKANSPAVAHHGMTVIGFNWIGGKELEGDLPSFDARSAVDSRDTVGIFPECGERDVEKAAKAAALAFRTWRDVPGPERAAADRPDRGAPGQPQGEAGRGDHPGGGQAAPGGPGRSAGDHRPLPLLPGRGAGSGRTGRIRTASAGPWGSARSWPATARPWPPPAGSSMPALLYGNTVVWKPSVNAPTTAYLLVRCMMDAGLPPGVVNVVNGKGRAGCGKFFLAGLDKGLLPEVLLHRAPPPWAGSSARWPGATWCRAEPGAGRQEPHDRHARLRPGPGGGRGPCGAPSAAPASAGPPWAT